MRVVDHHQCIELIGQFAHRGKVGKHTVHREHPIGSNEDRLRAVGAGLRQLGAQIGHVVVRVAIPPRPAEADAVDDRRMVQGVADHSVLLTEDRLEQATVGVEA